jgi:hypothetical protein
VTRGGVVLTVNGDRDEVERQLAGGELACSSCDGVLGGWGNARLRRVRVAEGPDAEMVPRRSRCRQCGATHVLLPAWCLLRRADAAAVIGAALEAGTVQEAVQPGGGGRSAGYSCGTARHPMNRRFVRSVRRAAPDKPGAHRVNRSALAADLGDGTDDQRATAPDLLRRSLACLPERARQPGRVALRADAGYFAGQLARAAHDARIAFAIGQREVVQDAVSRALEPGVALIVVAFDPVGTAALAVVPPGVPMVAAVETPAGDQGDRKRWVWINDREAAARATEYLLSLGHRTVHYISIPSSTGISPRLTGWTGALTAAGM